MKPYRPVGVKYLVVILAFASLWNSLRLIEAILFWDVLSEFHAKGGPLYIAVSGGAWALLASVVGWAMWIGKPWSWGAALGLVAGFGSWICYDQFVMQTARTNELFTLGLTFVWLIGASLFLFSKKVRIFYHER